MNIKRNKPNNLIICTSILQIIIAEKIIGLYPNSNFDLLVIAAQDSKKYRYYYDRLRKQCNNSLFYLFSGEKGAKKYFIYKHLLRKHKLNKRYKKVYLASFSSQLVQIVLSKQNRAEVYTFDDGLANIIQESHYYTISKLSRATKIKKWLIGAKLNSEQIKNKSIKHYTLYKDIPNIVENTEYISIFDTGLATNDCISTPSKSVEKIFIGQPLHMYGNVFNSNYIQNTMGSLNITAYYPHPKEKILPVGNFEIVDSELIFEEYLLNYLKENPTKTVHVYSFYSSCLPNIANIKRVELTYIHNDLLWDKFENFYKSCYKRFGINHIRIN